MRGGEFGHQTEGNLKWTEFISDIMWLLGIPWNWVLRRIFTSKSELVTGGWKKCMRSFTICPPCPNVIRVIKPWVMRLVWPAAYMGEKINAYKVLTQKPEGKIPP
jgi:hypothetical protein